MSFSAPDVAIDLGTTNTLVYVKGRGIVIREPTLVVVDGEKRDRVLYVGDEAGYRLGRTRDASEVIRPVRGGEIIDFNTAKVMIRYFLRKAIGTNHLIRPRVLLSVPASLPALSRRALYEAVTVAGVRKIFTVEKALAAAIGSGLPVYEPIGSMVVDIGGGTTDTAIVSLGGMVVSQSVDVGGNRMDDAIVSYLKTYSSMLIGDRTAEQVKIDLASAMPPEENRYVHVRGRDLLSTHAMDVEFTTAQAYEAVREPCTAILASVKWVLERTPPELAADIMRNGIHLTGGASQIARLDRFIATSTGIPVLVAREPADCTILGLGYLLENQDLLEGLQVLSAKTA
ncbi:MAG: rod shape-determining protein [Clostridia bacterium]|nr:rod shape-determining protein [Clostridia bacterium]MBR1683939.1 rod shape-determining protein [Clostridia bacterium]MBR2288037.1 rod shape-determining protein [Clostridia bacterium]